MRLLRQTSCLALFLSHFLQLLFVASGETVGSWTLYHAVVSSSQAAVFEKRASITLSIPEGSSAAAIDIHNLEATTSSNVMNQLIDVETPKLYQLKLVADKDSSSARPLLTTVPTCQVLRANFRDELVLTFGRDGTVISIGYIPLVSPLAPKSCQDLEQITLAPFNSKISIEMEVKGMTLRTVLPSFPKPPPGLKFLPKAKLNTETGGGGAGGGTGGEQPPISGPTDFVKRYWYIILPIMLMNLFASSPPAAEEGDGNNKAELSQGAAEVGTSAVAAAAVTADSPRPKRRDKRG